MRCPSGCARGGRRLGCCMEIMRSRAEGACTDIVSVLLEMFVTEPSVMSLLLALHCHGINQRDCPSVPIGSSMNEACGCCTGAPAALAAVNSVVAPDRSGGLDAWRHLGIKSEKTNRNSMRRD
jgi:hypothetical protein